MYFSITRGIKMNDFKDAKSRLLFCRLCPEDILKPGHKVNASKEF